jgi:opacity protein-like surface antigen
MKSKLLLFALLFTTLLVKSQEWEVGVTLGPMNYQGDLAQASVNLNQTKFNLGALGRYTISPLLAVRGEVNFGKVSGDDKYAVIPPEAYGHNKRNLNFQSNIFEVSASLEYNFFKYVPGARRKRFTPFVSAGIGIFHFNPTTTYQGQKVQLQPLPTELNKPLYSLTQLCFPIGGGIKWNVSKTWTFGFNYATRFTLTDYIDDVSHNWQTQPTPGNLGQTLTYRGDETNDPNWQQTNIQNWNDPNSKTSVNRGDPRDRDTYMVLGFSLTKTFRKFACNQF